MSNQLRFEGSELETLLTQVRSEMGDGARIVAANRIRKGGVGGFFAREVYEIVVDTGDGPKADDRRLRPAARLGRRRSEGSTIVEPRPTTVTMPEAPMSVLDLVDAVDSAERADRTIDLAFIEETEVPTVSTQSDDFAAMLERLTGEHDEHDDDDFDATTASIAADTTPPAPMVPRLWEAVASSTPSRDADTIEVTVTSAPVVPTVPPVAPMPIAAAAPTRRARNTSDLVDASIATVPFDDIIERPETVLARMGLPARLVPRGKSGMALRSALVESLAALPEVDPLPAARGVAVAVIGVGARPIALARILAAEHGVDPDSVVVAIEDLHPDIPECHQINDAATAEERRRSWRRREQVSFVAVSMPSIAAGTRWANDLLDSLEATQVIAVAHAGWKPDDVAAWSERLGGFDALAIERTDDTISPAALLETRIPVARIDAELASAVAWADLMLDRIVIS